MCSTVSESERPGGRRVALLSEMEVILETKESVEVYEGLRGGSGGRDFGGDSKLMSGVEDKRATVGLLASLRCLALDGGPSSTIQSFRSINEVLRPRFGGEGDGDLLKDFKGVIG